MKIEISIEKNGGEEKNGMGKPELSDEQKVAIGRKIKKNMTLTRLERNLLEQYLLNEKED
jgi:hypothetical protein